MHAEFSAHVESLQPKLAALLAMPPLRPIELPAHMPKAGVYLLSEGEEYLYVGRSNDLRHRILRHSRPGATHRMASFAFRLARHQTGNLFPSYKKGEDSREALIADPAFFKAFSQAKARICQMEFRYVEESDPVRQTLLEIYVAVVLKAKHNDFNNH